MGLDAALEDVIESTKDILLEAVVDFSYQGLPKSGLRNLVGP